MRSALVALGVILGAGSLVFLGPTGAASAATPTAPSYGDDGTGSGPVVGVAVGDLGAWNANSTTWPNYDMNGWTGNGFASLSQFNNCNGTLSSCTITSGQAYAAVSCWVDEPMRNIYDGSGYSGIIVPLACDRFDAPAPTSTLASASVQYGYPTGSTPDVVCAATAHSNSADDWHLSTTHGPATTGGGDDENPDRSRQWQRLNMGDDWRPWQVGADPSCPYLVSITFDIAYADTVTHITSKTLTWTAASALAGGTAVTRGDAKAACNATDSDKRQDICTEILASGDAPITCHWDWGTSGDWFADFATWVGGGSAWFGCMFIPQGWDRSHALAQAMGSGTAAQTLGSLTAALPSNLACGSVGSIPGLEGTSVPLNTCALDVMPVPFKNVLGYALTLPIAWLGVKRIFWALGGDSAPAVNVKSS